MQQPTSGVTLKSYVSGCNCSWMNGKASKLLPLPPSLPPPGTWSKHHTLLWVAPESQPWPPLQPLCARGRRGSPYPFLIDTHTEWHWPTPDSPPPVVLWHCYFENVTPQMWVTLSAFLEYTCVPSSHARKQTGMHTKPLVCRGQYWCKQAAMRSEENESSSVVNGGGDQPGDVAEVRWVKAGEAWHVTHNKCFVVASHSILLADTSTNISALNQSDLKRHSSPPKAVLFVSVWGPSHEEARACDGVGC